MTRVSLLIAVCLASLVLSSLPPFEMGGFHWAENLAFDGKGRLFVADAEVGTIWRIFLDEATNTYKKEVHIDAFKKALGLTFLHTPPDLVTGFAVVVDKAVGGTSYIISFDPSTNSTNRYTTVAEIPGGNGLDVFTQDQTLFTSTEGGLTGPGLVTRVSIATGAVDVIAQIDGANGLKVDNARSLLHVGSLRDPHFHVFKLPSLEVVSVTPAYGQISMDDFCLARNGSLHIAADYFNNRVVASNWEDPKDVGLYVVQGDDTPLSHPTSVEWGAGPGFNSSLLYVTEGGVSVRPKSRVLTIEPALKPVQSE